MTLDRQSHGKGQSRANNDVTSPMRTFALTAAHLSPSEGARAVPGKVS